MGNPKMPQNSRFPSHICHKQHGQMLLDPSLRSLGTRIWTQNLKYRMKLKGTIAKTLFIPPCPSTLLLTVKQPDQHCVKSDIPGCSTRKLKIQQYCKTEYTQIIAMSRVFQKILVFTNFFS